MKNCILIGLTGQSGAGKTTVSKYFADMGFAVINCDLIARKITEAGSECNKDLAVVFPECFDENYTLNRQALGKIVFNDSQKLQQLNNIIFPYIIKRIKTETDILSAQGVKYIILDAPTLFEAGADKLCHCIVSCTADEIIRAKRIAARDKIPMNLIFDRFSSQKSEQFFRENSDYIIENNNDKSNAFLQCDKIIKNIKRKFDE